MKLLLKLSAVLLGVTAWAYFLPQYFPYDTLIKLFYTIQ
jgi:hypothetical protein